MYCLIDGNDNLIAGPSRSIRQPRSGEIKIRASVPSKPRCGVATVAIGPKFIKINELDIAQFGFELIANDIDDAKSTAFDIVAKKRKSIVDDGIMFDGDQITGDEKNINRLMSIWIGMQIDPTRTIKQKIKNGDHKLKTKADIDALSEALTQHVQGSFSRESDIADLIIAADNVIDIESIINNEVNTGWPS